MGSSGLPGKGDAKSVHVGEVRHADPARHVLLAEYHRLLGAMVVSSNGTTSVSKRSPSGYSRHRLRWAFYCEGSFGSRLIRYPVAWLKPAFA